MLKSFKKYIGGQEERLLKRAKSAEKSRQRKHGIQCSRLDLEMADIKRREEIALMRSRVAAKHKRIEKLQVAAGSGGSLMGSFRKYTKNIGRPGSFTVPSMGDFGVPYSQSESRRGAKRRKRKKKRDPIGELVGI